MIAFKIDFDLTVLVHDTGGKKNGVVDRFDAISDLCIQSFFLAVMNDCEGIVVMIDQDIFLEGI